MSAFPKKIRESIFAERLKAVFAKIIIETMTDPQNDLNSGEDELVKSAKEFAESLVRLVGSTAKTVLKGVEETFPNLSNTAKQVLLDLDRTGQDLLRSLDNKTIPEQKVLLEAYRKILLAQLGKVEERLKKLEQPSK